MYKQLYIYIVNFTKKSFTQIFYDMCSLHKKIMLYVSGIQQPLKNFQQPHLTFTKVFTVIFIVNELFLTSSKYIHKTVWKTMTEKGKAQKGNMKTQAIENKV